MNKEYMMPLIQARKDQLLAKYKNIASYGLTKQGAHFAKSKAKRDYCILALLEEVLSQCENVCIKDEDALLGFEKIIMEKKLC